MVYFYTEPEKIEHTYKVETVVDIFSKVSGLFYTVMNVQKFFLSSFLTYYATKYLVDDLYGNGTFVKNEQYYGYKHHEMWKSWDAPNTPNSHAGF